MSLYLAQEVINNAFADLTDNLELGGTATLSNMQSSIVVSETFQQNYHRKKKRPSIIPVEHPNGVDLSIKTCSKKLQAPLSVKIAALETLKALLTMGGSLRSESWRPDVDCLVATVATNACDAGWANVDKLSMLADESSFADYQLATLKVLLASLHSPTKTRPAYLSLGLDLFRRGRKEAGSKKTKIAAFCVDALSALESLIHPRFLPLVDHLPKNLSVDEGFNQRFAGSTFNNGIKTSSNYFSKGDLGILDEEDEELSNGWFDKNDGQTFSESKNLNDKSNEITKQFSNASEDITMKPSAINAEVTHHVLSRENSFLQNVDAEMACLGKDETTADREKTEECRSRNEISFYNASNNKMDFVQGSSAISVAEMASGKSDSPLVISTNMSNHDSDAPSLSVETSKEDATYKILPDFYKGKDAKLSYDSDSDSLDSLPDIVDGDPDTE